MLRRINQPAIRPPAGFTLVELLVAIAIIGLLIAISLPAVQKSRASARRMQCMSHLRQIGIATHQYVDTHGQLPINGPASGLFFSILPYLEQTAEHDRLEKLLLGSFDDQMQASLTVARLEIYLCPDDALATHPGSMSYAENVGIFNSQHLLRAFDQGGERWSDVPDGLSQTALCSELRAGPEIQGGAPPAPGYGKWFAPFRFTNNVTQAEMERYVSDCLAASQSGPPVVPYSSGGYMGYSSNYNHVGGPNSPPCESGGSLVSYPAVSNHTGGVNVLLADGAVKFAATNIDIKVWRAIGSRDGGEIEANSF